MRDYALNRSANFDDVIGGSFIHRIARNWRARRAVVRLENLDDCLLLDAGLYRSDLHWAAGLPLTINPELALKKRVAARDRQG
jgi:hypothetical protein